MTAERVGASLGRRFGDSVEDGASLGRRFGDSDEDGASLRRRFGDSGEDGASLRLRFGDRVEVGASLGRVLLMASLRFGHQKNRPNDGTRCEESLAGCKHIFTNLVKFVLKNGG